MASQFKNIQVPESPDKYVQLNNYCELFQGDDAISRLNGFTVRLWSSRLRDEHRSTYTIQDDQFQGRSAKKMRTEQLGLGNGEWRSRGILKQRKQIDVKNAQLRMIICGQGTRRKWGPNNWVSEMITIIRNWWRTYPPRACNCRTWVKFCERSEQYSKLLI